VNGYRFTLIDMSTSSGYVTSGGRGVGSSGITVAPSGVRTDSGGYDWLYYIIYFFIALLLIWGILFILIRTGVVGPSDWLYENTKWIPTIGENSWARNKARSNTQ